MKIPTAIGVVISIGILSFNLFPNNYKHEKNIKSLAYSYGIYHSHVCPNSNKLDTLKYEYLRQTKLKQSEKEWINNNFNRTFEIACLGYEVERSKVNDYV